MLLGTAVFDVQDMRQFVHDLERPVDLPVPQVSFEMFKGFLEDWPVSVLDSRNYA